MQRLLEKQKELTERVRANEKVVAAIGLLGSIAVAFIGAGYFAPKAEACSPPRDLDGNMLPFTCPPMDDVVVCLSLDCPQLSKPSTGIKDESFEDNLDPDVFHRGQTVTLFDTREEIAHMGHSFPTDGWIQKMRDWQSQQDRMSIDEMLNSALEDMEDNNGSNGSTEQEELLQLQGNRD